MLGHDVVAIYDIHGQALWVIEQSGVMLELAIEAKGQRHVMLVLLIWVEGERGVTLELVICDVEYLSSCDMYPGGCSSLLDWSILPI